MAVGAQSEAKTLPAPGNHKITVAKQNFLKTFNSTINTNLDMPEKDTETKEAEENQTSDETSATEETVTALDKEIDEMLASIEESPEEEVSEESSEEANSGKAED